MARPHRRLGELLMEAGFVTRAQLDDALALRDRSHTRLGKILEERGLITSVDLARALCHQLTLPWVSLAHVEFSASLVRRLPAEIARRYRVVPVYLRRRGAEDTLYLATDDPTDESVLAACAAHVVGKVRLMVAASDDIDRTLRAHFGMAPAPLGDRSGPSVAMPHDAASNGAVLATGSLVVPPGAPPKPRLSDAVELGWEDFELVDEPPPDSAREPVVLLVQVDDEFALQCARVAKKLTARVERAEVMDAASAAAKYRPFILLVTEEAYGFDRIAFTKLSIKIGAHLVIWSDELDAEYLEPILVAARNRQGWQAAHSA